VRIRGCPAAVSENDSTRRTGLLGWEAVEGRNPAKAEALASPKTCHHPATGRQPSRFRPGSLEGGAWVWAGSGYLPSVLGSRSNPLKRAAFARGGEGRALGSPAAHRNDVMTDADLDPSRCPLCRQRNECGMADDTGTCWCFDLSIPADVLNPVPRELANLACLCQTCLSDSCHQTSKLEKIRDFVRTWRWRLLCEF